MIPDEEWRDPRDRIANGHPARCTPRTYHYALVDCSASAQYARRDRLHRERSDVEVRR
jgi:hypothetical protein